MCLGSKPFLAKNRVGFSVYQGLWEFWGEFSEKKSPAQFVFGFGVFGTTARLGRKWGEFTHAFLFEENRNTTELLEYKDSFRNVHTCLPV